MNRRKGAAMVEVAVGLPFVVAVFVGLLDFGMYFHQQTHLELGLQVATRMVLSNPASASEGEDPAILLQAARKAASIPNLELRTAREGDYLRIDVAAPIAPLLPGMRSLGYPEKNLSRAFVRLQ